MVSAKIPLHIISLKKNETVTTSVRFLILLLLLFLLLLLLRPKEAAPVSYRPHAPSERPPPSSALATVSGFHKRITRRILRGTGGSGSSHQQEQKQQRKLRQQDDDNDDDGDDDDDNRDKRRIEEDDRDNTGEGRGRIGGGRGGEKKGSGKGDYDEGGGGGGGGSKKRSRCGKHITCVADSHTYEVGGTARVQRAVYWQFHDSAVSPTLILQPDETFRHQRQMFTSHHKQRIAYRRSSPARFWLGVFVGKAMGQHRP